MPVTNPAPRLFTAICPDGAGTGQTRFFSGRARDWLRRQSCTLVLAGASVALPAIAPAQQTGSISGQLIDERSGRPVPNALVQLVGSAFRTTTNESGHFQLRSIPPGTYRLQLEHLAFGSRTVDATVAAGSTVSLRVSVTETAITLAPLTVEAVSNTERQRRGEGFNRGVVTREQIARAENTNMTLADVLVMEMPSMRVKRAERIVGAPVCIELRQVREGLGPRCLSPAVYLDGAQVTDPTSLYNNLDLRMIERIEVVPTSEAGVRFGPGALYGALLIYTRRPGTAEEESVIKTRNVSFDWKMEPGGHRTALVFIASAAGNAAGLALGASVARGCLDYRPVRRDGLVTHCDLLPTLGSGAAALLLPSLASGLAARLVGRTDRSHGDLIPATVGALMAVVPAYAITLSAERSHDDGLRTVGHILLGVGAPIMSTTADYLFRKLREQPRALPDPRPVPVPPLQSRN